MLDQRFKYVLSMFWAMYTFKHGFHIENHVYSTFENVAKTYFLCCFTTSIEHIQFMEYYVDRVFRNTLLTWFYGALKTCSTHI